MAEEIFPFTSEYAHNLVTILDEDDLRGTKFWSDETLLEQYKRAKNGGKPA
jgi:hypothetical protein